jgi:hypothetical protein
MSLRELRLEDNSLSGEIPKSIGLLVALTHLKLSGNALNGSIPSSLGSLAALELLKIDNNQLTGIIPSSISNLTSLLALYLESNLLEGPVPILPASLTSCNISSSNTVLCETYGAGNLCTEGLSTCVTDCVIMNAWLPAMFNGTGIECCSQAGLICVGDRVNEMYELALTVL